jgi:hypothetical protein
MESHFILWFFTNMSQHVLFHMGQYYGTTITYYSLCSEIQRIQVYPQSNHIKFNQIYSEEYLHLSHHVKYDTSLILYFDFIILFKVNTI